MPAIILLGEAQLRELVPLDLAAIDQIEAAFLSLAQLRELVPLDLAAIDQIEAAFLSLATEPVAMPPILRLDLPEHAGEVDVKTAWLPRFDSFAIKVSPGFFNNPSLGLPSLNGLMLVL